MTDQSGPLYELTFSVESESAADFGLWLKTFAEASKDEHGIVDCRVVEASADQKFRTCLFQIEDDRALDELLEGFLVEIEDEVAQMFDSAVTVSSRTLREDAPQHLPLVESSDCLNCGARLRGQYCGICGQRARNRLIRLWDLISEAFGDLLELDSRLWRTLIPLLRRPGRLTRDYLEGRRARYMPPFRTYLVLSLIFFVVAFFDPRDDLSLLFEPEPEPTPEEAIDDETGACNVEGGDLEDLPEWFKRRFTPDRIKKVCESITADGGKSFGNLLLDNVPVALIVLLPLMALVLKVLYPLSRRYFVEHLLFVIHYHAFFFLILILQILLAHFAALIRIPEFGQLLAVAVSLYIPVYLYMAMRQVYGQGRFLTFLKYLALVVAYSVGTALTMLGAAFFALAAV